MLIRETARLIIRQLTIEDAPFILQLLNTPTWITFIGNRNINGLGDARNYLVNGPLSSYSQHGFGLYLVYLKEENIPIGMTGLIKRATLDDVDLGFAFLPEYTGKGYAAEAAEAVLDYAKQTLGLPRIVAIVMAQNTSSTALLNKLGLRYEKMILLPGDDAELMYFRLDFPLAES
jgi:RimJ/RimL family protein N-acetyltransferase